MRAVVVVVLPDLPEGDQSAVDAAFTEVAKALSVLGEREQGSVIACVDDCAEAVIRAAKGEPSPPFPEQTWTAEQIADFEREWVKRYRGGNVKGHLSL
jgi:hypothetical protein